MEIYFDFSGIPVEPFAFWWWFFKNGGWSIFLIFLCWGAIYFWLYHIRQVYNSKREFTLLAIDIPKQNIQSPKAVEQIFAHLSAIPIKPNIVEKWWYGEMPESFSLEIISLGGYIQFLIHTHTKYRDLIEAAIYAQYPDAEIVEVEDYAQKINIRFPNPEYDLWGTELVLAKPEYYPIKTYPFFEHPLSQELKDPMAALLETLGKIGPDEQIWFQLIITPAPDNWKETGERAVKKLIGAKVKVKKGVLGSILEFPVNLLIDILTPGPAPKKEEPPSLMQYLSPGEKEDVQAIENKISKIGLYTRLRVIYLARKESFKKEKGAIPVLGAIAQFNTLNLNSLKKSKKYTTKKLPGQPKAVLYFKQNRILKRFKNRGRRLKPGGYGYVLNTEELASLYHFPVMEVKAPLVKKTETKKAEPPLALPTEELFKETIETRPTPSSVPKPTSPPENLPVE